MFDNMRRLHPRGPTNRGICVDADGAMLGPDCMLVEHSLGAHRPLTRRIAKVIQSLFLPDDREPDWLFEQSGRIARALDEGQVALAQIYGLFIPIDELDDRHLTELARVTAFTKTGFNPDEPRIPRGDPHGGEWTDGGDGEDDAGSPPGPTPDAGAGGPEGDADEGGSGSSASPTPSDLGAGDSDSGGDGDGGDGATGGSSDGVPTPASTADVHDTPPQSPTRGQQVSAQQPSPP